ncbi:MAG: SDR family oxidoreductase [Microbacteriaceae bacterium]|nr:SDR family oxidoreductase [Microbacteriaceae bacterium]MCL2796085.1 SDR family oxidoreductase [Microbacteriaceae bacterium]
MDFPLAGRTALVTGVSRPKGIGFAVARRLAAAGANVVVHHFAPHDADQPWGGADVEAVRAGIRSTLVDGAQTADFSADLADAAAPAALIESAAAVTGRLDILVCNHARSGSDGSILEATPEMLDGHWDVNARATFLLTRHFADRFVWSGAEDATGRVVWFTSGQLHGPMRPEFAYVASKGAIAGATQTAAAELLSRGILLNTVNPGPTNTGYLDAETTDRPEMLDELRAAMPLGRFGAPDDVARLISFLVGPEGRWIVGEVVSSDGGFRLGG